MGWSSKQRHHGAIYHVGKPFLPQMLHGMEIFIKPFFPGSCGYFSPEWRQTIHTWSIWEPSFLKCFFVSHICSLKTPHLFFLGFGKSCLPVFFAKTPSMTWSFHAIFMPGKNGVPTHKQHPSIRNGSTYFKGEAQDSILEPNQSLGMRDKDLNELSADW